MNPGDPKPRQEERESPLPEKEGEEMVFEELKRILSEAQKKDVFGIQEKIVEKFNELKSAYGIKTLENCRLYHLLIGSSTVEGHKPTTFDVDGQIEAFIRELEENENKKATNRISK